MADRSCRPTRFLRPRRYTRRRLRSPSLRESPRVSGTAWIPPQHSLELLACQRPSKRPPRLFLDTLDERLPVALLSAFGTLLDPPSRPHRTGTAHAQGGRHGQALAMQTPTAPLAAPAQPTRQLVSRMPRVRKATGLQRWGIGPARLLIGRCRQRRPESLLAAALGDPGRGRGHLPQARPQLLGHDLDHGSGAAVLSSPAPLLEPTHDYHPAALARDCAACSAWSRQTTTVKNDGSCSRRLETATGTAPGRCRSRWSGPRFRR